MSTEQEKKLFEFVRFMMSVGNAGGRLLATRPGEVVERGPASRRERAPRVSSPRGRRAVGRGTPATSSRNIIEDDAEHDQTGASS